MASSKNEMDSHQKFGSYVETDDAIYSKKKWKRFRTHIMELFWVKWSRSQEHQKVVLKEKTRRLAWGFLWSADGAWAGGSYLHIGSNLHGLSLQMYPKGDTWIFLSACPDGAERRQAERDWKVISKHQKIKIIIKLFITKGLVAKELAYILPKCQYKEVKANRTVPY